MNDRFLRACRRQPVDCTPVWFMRQAGRYMADYRALRAKHTMLELCRTPELAVEVTLQPLRFGFDAAIVFSDILLPLEPMGAPFHFSKSDGPVMERPIRDQADIDRMRVIDPEESLDYVLESIRLLRRELEVPLIGFAGAPFTLASYLIEGGKSANYARTKRLMLAEPDAWGSLMSKLAEVVRRHLRAQVEAGAQAVQLFDSWVGQLAPDDYETHVAPHVGAILRDLEATGVPVVHFGTGTATLLEVMAATGGTVIGLDWRIPLDDGWKRVGENRAVQGNLDPTTLFAPREIIRARAQAVLDRAAGRPGHIFNLGHGILPETPEAEVHALVDFIHQSTERT
ncbi:MAG: uroporphyrinogen decarboxylase [Myxococcota bacterium]